MRPRRIPSRASEKSLAAAAALALACFANPADAASRSCDNSAGSWHQWDFNYDHFVNIHDFNRRATSAWARRDRA